MLDANEIMIVSEQGIIERFSLAEVPVKGRITQGVWIMRDKEREDMTVATVASISVDRSAAQASRLRYSALIRRYLNSSG